MGICLSSADKETKERNEEIEAQLKKDKLAARNEIKMLLLGNLFFLLFLLSSDMVAAGMGRWRIKVRGGEAGEIVCEM